jgi:hypothetical protein
MNAKTAIKATKLQPSKTIDMHNLQPCNSVAILNFFNCYLQFSEDI